MLSCNLDLKLQEEIEDEALATAQITRASQVEGARRGPLDIFSLPPTAFMPVDFKLPPELIGGDISSLQGIHNRL